MIAGSKRNATNLSSCGAQSDTALEHIHAYIQQHCVVRRSDSNIIRAPSGRIYNWAFDFRPLLLDGHMLKLVSSLFWEAMNKFWPFQVAGLEVTAIPLVAAILMEGERRGHPTTGLIVRRKRKKYGRERLVEGEPAEALPVILVDDTINSARSINMTLLAIKSEGLQALAAFSIANFNSQATLNWCLRNNLTIYHLFTPRDFGLFVSDRSECSTSYSIAWTFASPKPNYRFTVAKSEPVVYQDSLLFGSDSGVFWCLDKKKGRVKWSYDTKDQGGKGIISSPALAEGRIYFGAYNGVLYCLDALNGSEIWKEKACNWIGSSPCYANGHIYVGLEYDSPGVAGGLAKFSGVSGRREWEVPTRRMLHGSPVYSEKHKAVIVGTNDATVLAIDAASGAVRNLLKTGGPVKYHCGLANDLAVFGSFDGKIYVWDFIRDCVKLTIQTEDIVYSRPLICDHRAFVGCADHTLRVVDLERLCEVHRLDVGERIHSSPTLVGKTVFVGTSGGELFGINLDSLAVTHRWQFPERLTNGVIYNDGMLYVLAYDNKVWALTL